MAVRRTNGEGCYVNMPSGKIQMRKQCGFLANGRPRVLSVTGKSRAECNRLMKEKEAKVTGIVSMAKDSTVEELCRCHLSSQMAQRDRLKPTAIDRREGTIKNQIMPYPIAHMQAVSVRPKDIENHIEKLLAESRLSASSIEKVFHVLNGAYKWGISMEYLTYNPCEPVKEGLRLRFKRLNEKEADDKDVIVLSPDEIRLVKENALERKGSGFYVHPIGPYVLFLLLTGMRVGELCALRWEHVRWDNDMTVVSIKGTRHHIKDRSTPEPTYKVVDGKTKNMHSRHIVLSEEAASLLKLIYQEARDTSPESYVLVNRRYKATNPSNRNRSRYNGGTCAAQDICHAGIHERRRAEENRELHRRSGIDDIGILHNGKEQYHNGREGHERDAVPDEGKRYINSIKKEFLTPKRAYQ